MFHWYQRAANCYIFLDGIPKHDHDGVAEERWATWKLDFQSSG
jgi:hypothetical protein